MTATEPANEAPTRHGGYRDLALAHYGKQCQNEECGWEPTTEAELHKLHVHHETPRAEGGPDDIENLTVLCRDCHLAHHSESAFSHELVGRLTSALADAITHKRDGFTDRVARRVRLDSVALLEDTPGAEEGRDREGDDGSPPALVEGLFENDFYDEYFVNIELPYLRMCSCYEHSFGVVRARNICTHVGATIVRRGIEVAEDEGEDAALAFVREVGRELNGRAEEYLKKRDLVEETIDTLDIAEDFSESWADRARRQATKMARYDREWRCFEGECEGCEVTLTAEGYRCTDANAKGWEAKWPCPGKLGAHILNETGDTRAAPDFDVGTVFRAREAVTDGIEEGELLSTIDRDDEARVVTFSPIERESAPVEVDYATVTDAVLSGTLHPDDVTDLTGWGIRLVTDENGAPRGVAPDLAEGMLMGVHEDFHPELAEGDAVFIGDHDDEARELRVDVATGSGTVTMDYSTAVAAIRDYAITKDLPDDAEAIQLTKVVDGKGGRPQVAIKSPYEAKDDIKSLDRGETDRWWDRDRSAWLVNADALDMVVEHLNDCGWDVYIRPEVRDHEATEMPDK